MTWATDSCSKYNENIHLHIYADYIFILIAKILYIFNLFSKHK